MSARRGRKIFLVGRDQSEPAASVSDAAAMRSEYLAAILSSSDGKERTHFTLDVPTDALREIARWLEYHTSIPCAEMPIPLPHFPTFKEIAGEWDATFAQNLTLPQLCAVLLGANYLCISDLVDLCCAKIAHSMLGKTPDEIRLLFGIAPVPRFTAAEMQHMQQHFPYLSAPGTLD